MSYHLLRSWSDPEMQRKALWVAAMMGDSKASAAVLGITPEAVVGQSGLETGWGKHVVGQHNLFGIKVGVGWTGARVLVHTREVINGQSVMIDDWFRDYETFADSIADHLTFLRSNTRYRDAGVFARLGDQPYFEALQRAGYATDPNYARQLLAMRDTVRDYFLPHMTDEPGAAAWPAPAAPPAKVSAPCWLMVGSQGADVIELQRRLGFTNPDDLDGRFGKDTRAAVLSFQAAHPPLDVDGVAGTATLAALGL